MNNNDFPDALPPQYRLHWYVLESVLGQGGFGITYLARDTNLDMTVAVKEYLPVDVATRRSDSSVRSRTEDQNQRFRGGLERFIREARTLARFDHPNIVRVHSVFELNGTAYMVMRFEEGETLAALLERRHSLPEAELMKIIIPILDGLELVHGAGFIHRDIKPDNIHIRLDGSPVLLDFGSARFALGQARTVTILVAPGYAPIEQYYNSAESQGPWTDIYGLGATCYRAIAGHAPLDAIERSKGKLGSTQEMLLPAAVVGKGRYSEGFLDAIDSALEFAEKERPQTINDWRRRLVEVKPIAIPAPSAAAAEFAPAPRPKRRAEDSHSLLTLRRPWLWAIGGALAVLLALFVWMPKRVEPPTARDSQAVAPGQAAPKGLENVDELRKQLVELKQEQSETKTRLSTMLQRAADPGAKRASDPEPKRAPETRPRSLETKSVTQAPGVPAARTASPPSQVASTKSEMASIAAPVESPRNEPAAPDPSKMTVAAVVPAPTSVDAVAGAERELGSDNPQKAVALLKTQVQRNDVRAMVRLGDLHLQGEGVELSDQEALRLFRRAAEAGNSDAQQRLGDMYSKGRGVPQNNFQAYVWYSAAVRLGSGTARIGQENTAPMLQAAEIQQAKKLVDAMARSAKDK